MTRPVRVDLRFPSSEIMAIAEYHWQRPVFLGTLGLLVTSKTHPVDNCQHTMAVLWSDCKKTYIESYSSSTSRRLKTFPPLKHLQARDRRSYPFLHRELTITEIKVNTLYTTPCSPSTTAPKCCIQTDSPIRYLLRSTLQLALRIVQTARATLIFLLYRPGKAATFLGGSGVGGFADSTSSRPIFGHRSGLPRGSWVRFGTAWWCGGDLAGFYSGFEFFGPFANLAELPFDGIVCCTFGES